MSAHSATLLLALAFAALDWVAVWRDLRRLEWVAKPLVIVALLGTVAAAGDLSDLPTILVIAALLGSLAGDVLLMVPSGFVLGLVAFLVAQLAYLARFLGEPLAPAGLVLGLAGAALLIGLVGRRIVGGARRDGLAAPVVVYLAAICAMAIAAAGSGRWLAAVGAATFVASDSLLGWDRFVRGTGRPGRAPGPERDRVWRIAVIATYHVAQVLLVVGLVP